jgi:hypothetical protein
MGLTIVPPDVTPTITDLERLRDISPLAPDMLAAADVVITDARTYPPELPDQRYVRSGDLGDGWDRQISIAGPTLLVVDITNPTPYGPYVQGDEEQAPVHMGRWKTETQLLDGAADRIAEILEAGVNDLAEGRR